MPYPAAGLKAGYLARLKLGLPHALPVWLERWLVDTPLLGAGLLLPVMLPSPVDPSEPGPSCLLGLFEGARLVDEALIHAPGTDLVRRGWLPIGGCGRKGREIFVVPVDAASQTRPSDIHVWSPSWGAPRSLGLTLDALSSVGKPAEVQLRRRLPTTLSRGKAGPERAVRARPRRLSAAARTLPLFAH